MAADSGELDDDTAVDTSDVQGDICQLLGCRPKFTHAATANGGCAHVEEEGSAALMVHGG